MCSLIKIYCSDHNLPSLHFLCSSLSRLHTHAHTHTQMSEPCQKKGGLALKRRLAPQSQPEQLLSPQCNGWGCGMVVVMAWLFGVGVGVGGAAPANSRCLPGETSPSALL